MKTAAFHALGCKVNQYDTQAMLEKFRAAVRKYLVPVADKIYRAQAQRLGFTPVTEGADIAVINTCTVTGTGDKKSLQLARRLRREHPDSALILAGCLAQRKPEDLLETGARLVIGTQHRGEVVELLEKALRENTSINAVNELNATTPFEPLTITSQEEHTRATLKIQEGCNNHCTYCIIPSVRGPIRSRPVDEIRAEAERLAQAGFTELVLTGIHLTSYGRDFTPRQTLLDAIRAVQDVPGVRRIRLGSLEPTVATVEFAQALRTMDKVCPQFHLALQSGSDTVLQRMARRYNMRMYRQARAFIREARYAKIHVFPYSQREGTKAAVMPGQLSNAEKERRARLLIAVGDEMARLYREQWVNEVAEVLLEEPVNGHWTGYTPEYIAVTLPEGYAGRQGEFVRVRLTGLNESGMDGTPCE